MPQGKRDESSESAFKHFFDLKLLQRIAKAIASIDKDFDEARFLKLMQELNPLEMKPRVRKIRDELKHQLPKSYPAALQILMKAAAGGKLSSFDLWPFAEFIQTYGLEDLKLSLDALQKITVLFTAEFAVRPFLIKYPKETLRYLEKCARDPDEHLRRWASEGTRPRLPWGERLQDFIRDPSQALPILEILKFDDALYVRKSVSNHLNDIAKDHPGLVIKILSKWKKEAGETHAKKVEWIIHRSLRTLIKNGHPEALKLIGVSTDAKVKLSGFKLNAKAFKLGARMEFEFKLESLAKKPQKLVIDYIIHFVKSNQSKSPKVFKLKSVMLPGEETVTIGKSHHLKKVTTRVYYPGAHWLEIQVNGKIVKRAHFDLTL
jgi:3-methyladenine DNA glycosylase AlkC